MAHAARQQFVQNVKDLFPLAFSGGHIENGIIFGGRLAEYKYMDMHVVIENAMNRWNGWLKAQERGKMRIPLTHEMVDKTWRQQKFYGCNMAIGPKALFDKYCTLVFETMMPLWEEHFIQ